MKLIYGQSEIIIIINVFSGFSVYMYICVYSIYIYVTDVAMPVRAVCKTSLS